MSRFYIFYSEQEKKQVWKIFLENFHFWPTYWGTKFKHFYGKRCQMTKILVFVIFYFHGAQASIKLNSIRKTKKKKYWALLLGLNIISWNHKKIILGLSLKVFISLGHKCQLVMFGFSKITYIYVTFKVKISDGYQCPLIKVLFEVAILTKTSQKIYIMVAGKGLTKN